MSEIDLSKSGADYYNEGVADGRRDEFARTLKVLGELQWVVSERSAGVLTKAIQALSASFSAPGVTQGDRT